jgi:hypothetical protein
VRPWAIIFLGLSGALSGIGLSAVVIASWRHHHAKYVVGKGWKGEHSLMNRIGIFVLAVVVLLWVTWTKGIDPLLVSDPDLSDIGGAYAGAFLFVGIFSLAIIGDFLKGRSES